MCPFKSHSYALHLIIFLSVNHSQSLLWKKYGIYIDTVPIAVKHGVNDC